MNPKLLLDTHTLIWFYQNSPPLSRAAREAIESEGHETFVSMATLWEMSIKTGLGKLEIGAPLDQFVTDLLDNGLQILPIETLHVFRYQGLPFHHNDPFDRMLLAQALAEHFHIVSVDHALDAYLTGSPVQRIW
jgi:PIN domain nuclease of toxin-antitoxin system